MKVIAVIGFSIAMLSISAASAGIFVDKRDHPAKGTKTCTLRQLSSAYLEKQGNPYRKSPKLRVERNGSVSISVGEQTFPGTKVYFLIGGQRYSGDAGFFVSLDRRAVDALKKESLVQFTFTNWPDRIEISAADLIEGFQAAYSECQQFLGNTPSASSPLSLKPGT